MKKFLKAWAIVWGGIALVALSLAAANYSPPIGGFLVCFTITVVAAALLADII